MLPLPSTKYPTTQRTVIGTTDVYADDVVLNCDTSAGPVVINLGDIPADYFSTQYKLYIVDVSGNAAINNITINAGTGQTINNQANLVVSTNSSSTLILITGNTTYVALGTGLNTTPTFIPVTYVQLTNLITTGTIIPDADYLLLDAEFGSAPFLVATNVFLKGMTTKTTTITGEGIFYDADYQAIGNYSSITGFAGQLGVWKPILVTPLNSVCIWNNRHYVNISGANGLINPGLDVANWTLLTISTTNGYIQVVNSVIYNVTNNRIVYRIDLAGNQVERTVVGGVNSFNVFPFGNTKVRQNRVFGNSIFNICNNIFVTTCFNNYLTQDSIIKFGQTNSPSQIENFNDNKIDNSTINVDSGLALFSFNKIYSSQINLANNVDEITNCLFNLSTVNISASDGLIRNNNLNQCTFTIVTNNQGSIFNNNFDNSSFSLERNINPGSLISENNLTQLSALSIKDNEGTISNNSLSSGSSLNITTLNAAGSFIQYLDISDRSTFLTDTNSGVIGAKSGIIINQSSNFTITTNTAIVSGVSVLETSTFSITTCNETIENVTIKGDSSVIIRTIFAGSGGITSFYVSVVNVGLSGTFDLIVGGSTLSGTCMPGVSTVQFTLDLSDPAIYNAGTQTLTINPDITTILGQVLLTNAAGVSITQIANLSARFPVTFFNDNGITTFNSVALAGPPAINGIVSPNGNFAYNIKFNANCTDYIILNRITGQLNVVENAVIIT